MKNIFFIIFFAGLNFILQGQNIHTTAFVTNNAYVYSNLPLFVSGGEFVNNNSVQFTAPITGDNSDFFGGNGSWTACENPVSIFGSVKFFNFNVQSKTTVFNELLVLNNLIIDSTLYVDDNAQLAVSNANLGGNGYIALTNSSVLRVFFDNDTVSYLPVGDFNLFSPIRIKNANLEGVIDFSVANDKYSAVDADQYLNRYWSLNTENFSGNGQIEFFYNDEDIIGAENLLSAVFFDGTQENFEGDINFENNSLSFNELKTGVYTAQLNSNSAIFSKKYKIFSYENKIIVNCPELSDVRITDMSGRVLVQTENVLSEQFEISYPGIYIVNITNSNEILTRKVFVK